MSEPTYGSGQSYDPQGYGGSPYGGQQYGGQQYGGPPAQQQPYPSGQQPQQQPAYGGGYGQPSSGYPSGSYPAASPTTGSPSGSVPSSTAGLRPAADKLGTVATVLTIVGYVCAGAGALAFILWLAADGDGIYRFASALSSLVLGIGLGGLNFGLGSWLAHRNSTST